MVIISTTLAPTNTSGLIRGGEGREDRILGNEVLVKLHIQNRGSFKIVRLALTSLLVSVFQEMQWLALVLAKQRKRELERNYTEGVTA